MDPNTAHPLLYQMLLKTETIFATFEAMRDQVVFTDLRVIAVNVQGITGSKVDFTSIPYKSISAFSAETAGTFDRDCELLFFVESIGQVKFEIRGSFDLVAFNQIISHHIL